MKISQRGKRRAFKRNLMILTTNRLRVVAGVAMVICLACNTSPQAKETKYLRRGVGLFEKKDYSRALLEFRNATAVMPSDAEPYYQQGVTYLAMGNLRNGVASLRKATELNPRHEKAQVRLAELMATTRDKEVLQQAAGRLEAVLAASPDNSEANDALALTEWKLGKTEEAVNRLQDTLRKFPARLQTSMQLARVKLLQKDLAGAEQVLKRAVATAPESSAAELALGQLYLVLNDLPRAEAELRRSIELDPKNGTALLGVAAVQIAGHRMAEAEETYRRVSALPAPEFKPLYALFLFKNGKQDAAIAELERLAKQAPNDREARSRLVAAYQVAGKRQAAQKVLEAALKKNPKDTDALFQRAALLLKSGKAAEAAQDLKQVLHFKADFAEAHVAMAQVHKLQNQKMSERQELSEALRITPSLLQARVALARSFTAAGDAKSALDLLNAAPAAQKGTVAFVVERNWALMGAGEDTELKSVLDQALHVRRVPELVLQYAVLRLKQGNYAEAGAAAEELLQSNPEDIRWWRILMESYVGQKQPAKAEERLKSAVAAHPQSVRLAHFAAEWYLNSKNPEEARKMLETALRVNPQSVPSALALASLDYQEKRVDQAQQRLTNVLADDPQNVTALLMLGGFALERRDRQTAADRYRAVLAIDSANLLALNNLAYTLALTDPDEALKYAQQAAERAPDNAAVQDTLGWIYHRKALYGTAVRYLQTAVAKEPTPRRQFHLAMSYLRSGNREIGEKTLQLALRQAPDLMKTEEGW